MSSLKATDPEQVNPDSAAGRVWHAQHGSAAVATPSSFTLLLDYHCP